MEDNYRRQLLFIDEPVLENEFPDPVHLSTAPHLTTVSSRDHALKAVQLETLTLEVSEICELLLLLGYGVGADTP